MASVQKKLHSLVLETEQSNSLKMKTLLEGINRVSIGFHDLRRIIAALTRRYSVVLMNRVYYLLHILYDLFISINRNELFALSVTNSCAGP